MGAAVTKVESPDGDPLARMIGTYRTRVQDIFLINEVEQAGEKAKDSGT
jgi:hypothetical protein